MNLQFQCYDVMHYILSCIIWQKIQKTAPLFQGLKYILILLMVSTAKNYFYNFIYKDEFKKCNNFSKRHVLTCVTIIKINAYIYN